MSKLASLYPGVSSFSSWSRLRMSNKEARPSAPNVCTQLQGTDKKQCNIKIKSINTFSPKQSISWQLLIPNPEHSHISLTPLIFNPHQWLTLGSYSCYHLRFLTWQGCYWGRHEGTPGSWAEAYPASLTSTPECTSWQTESSPSGSCPRQEHIERVVNPGPRHKLDWY